VRFLRKKRKQLLKEKKLAEKAEKREVRRTEKQRLKQDRILEIQKREVDKKRLREDLDELKKRHLEEYEQYRAERLEQEKKHKLKAEKDRSYYRRRRKRLIKFYFKFQRRNALRTIRSLNLKTLKEGFSKFREQGENRKKSFLIFSNSFIQFLLAYIFFYLLSQASTMIAAWFYDFPTILYYWEVYFNITLSDWTPEAVKTVFSVGPVIAFLVGLIFIIIYSNLKEYTFRFKTFFLWGFIHSMTFLFGALLVGTLFETGLGHTIGWLYIMDTGKVLYSIISLFIMFTTGFLITKPFMFSANSYFTNLTRRNRKLFMHSQVTLPYLAGTALLILLREPRFMFYETFIMFTAVLILLPVIGSYGTYQDFYFEFEEKKVRFPWVESIVAAVILLAYRFGLEAGLALG
jgi:hypothetical protein